MLLWPSQRETSVMGMPYPRAADIPGMAGQATGPGDWLYRIEQVSALFSALQQLPGHHHALDLVGALVDLGDRGPGSSFYR